MVVSDSCRDPSAGFPLEQARVYTILNHPFPGLSLSHLPFGEPHPEGAFAGGGVGQAGSRTEARKIKGEWREP